MSPPHRRSADKLVVWLVSDGKPGHDNQSLGLAEALGRLVDTESLSVPAQRPGTAVRRWLTRRFPEVEGLPDPQLIIGAGHGTHATLLAARRCRGGRAIVLMSPSLPPNCFDLCLVPAHDDARGPSIMRTSGPLNRVRPGTPPADGPGLILLGGPSRHFVWHDDQLFLQLTAVVDADPDRQWIVATSRRTPASLLLRLKSMHRPGLEVMPHAKTGRDWLVARLAEAPRIWVSEDSISMIYEALTSGAAVGLIGLERGPPDRVSKEIDRLCVQGWVCRMTPGIKPPVPTPPPRILDEATRCAELILQRWPELNS
ncbi:MAG TPA: mitochondrial fission ELM1 family protein [Gammaproteobacteria bacterium]